MAITFEQHRKTKTTPKVRIGRKAHRLDTQIGKVKHILDNIRRFEAGDPAVAPPYYTSINDCVCYGGSEYLEARGVLKTEVETVEREWNGKRETYQQMLFYLTSGADVERCYRELLDMWNKLDEDDVLEIIEV